LTVRWLGFGWSNAFRQKSSWFGRHSPQDETLSALIGYLCAPDIPEQEERNILNVTRPFLIHAPFEMKALPL